MSTFVHCRGCGTQIHETAPTCPKCGGPQFVTAPVPPASPASIPSAVQAAAPSVSSSPPPVATASAMVPGLYADVPWYRRRWVLLLITWFMSPAAAVIAWTGDVHYLSRGTVKTFPKSLRIVLTVLSLVVVVCMASEEEAAQGLAVLVLIGTVLVLSLKK
jgi:hypothetical protein